jgi:hypothetical protein
VESSFQNVDYLAVEKVRQKTVAYVRNVHKCFIAYCLVVEIQITRKEAVEKVRGRAK